MIKNITIGSDPEFFIYKDDQVVSSIGIVKGTKNRPEQIEGDYLVHKDNVLIEGNIPPANSREEFVSNMKHWKELASEILAIGGYKLVCADSAEFPEEDLASDEAKTLGCAPYMNAWTLGLGSPAGLIGTNWRVAGGHLHIGYTLEENPNYDKHAMDILIARAFDYFVTFPARQHYDCPVRAEFYGEYGAFRNKFYGVECRSLGSHFMADEYLPWVYDQTIKALEFCSIKENCDLLVNVKSPDVDTEENYKKLNINLEEQLYDNYNPVNTTTQSLVKQTA